VTFLSETLQQSLMATEAAESATVVERQMAMNKDVLATVRASFTAAPPTMIMTCARGSSDHAATFGRFLFETRLGIASGSLPPSVASIYGMTPVPDGALCLAISQSGRSPDLLATIARCQERGIRTVAITNDEASPLAQIADTTLLIQAGPERSVAATKSYIGSLFALLQLAEAMAPAAPIGGLAALPGLLREAWRLDWSELARRLVDAKGLYVVGRGPGLAIASEAALKFKETSGLHAEAFSSAEIRHGPMALVDHNFPILVFRQNDESGPVTDQLVQDLVARGVPVFVAGVSVPGAVCLPTVAADALLEPLLQVQAFYRMVADLAALRGHDPDKPPQLSKVTETL
jgi:glucosamine--fructose-6-phosphate aminotransferase (isomerizing)